MQKELTIVFKDGGCKVLHADRGLIMKTKISSNIMFVVYAPVVLPMCVEISLHNLKHFWHCIYGHLSFKGIDTLIKKEMVKGILSLKDLEEICSDCLMEKQHKEAMQKQSTWRAKENIELIHSNVCGPIRLINHHLC